MKLALLFLQGQSATWTELASSEYAKKISAFLPFSELPVRSPSRERARFEEKREDEGRAILKALKDTSDRLILFDEKGRSLKSSREFSEFLMKNLGVGGRLVFAIGGPYGFSDEIRKRAAASVSFSGLTFNHHVARVVALEQIYRALSIWKGLPYHND